MQDTPQPVDPVKLSVRKRSIVEFRQLAHIGSPILFTQLLQMAVITVDTIMAGRYSANDLSGVAIGSSIWFPLMLAVFGLLSGLSPTVAHLHGGKRFSGIARNVYQSLYIALCTLPVIVLIVYSLSPLLAVIDADPAIRPITLAYLKSLLFGLPALLLFNVLRFYSDGLSHTRPALYASILGICINIPLNYALIYGHWGFPELGGVGCGWASAISFYVMCFFMLSAVITGRHYQRCPLHVKVHGLHRNDFGKLVRVGLPIGVAYFIESSMFGVIALFLASFGPIVVAAHQIALNFSSLIFMIPMSLSFALTIRVGYLLGAGQSREARFTAYLGVAIGIVYACVSAVLLYAFRDYIGYLYTDNAKVINMAATLFIYAALFQIGDAIQATAAGALRGYKDTRAAMYTMLLTFWFLGLPVGFVFGIKSWFVAPMQAEGFWLGLVVGLIATSVILMLRLRIISRGRDVPIRPAP